MVLLIMLAGAISFGSLLLGIFVKPARVGAALLGVPCIVAFGFLLHLLLNSKD